MTAPLTKPDDVAGESRVVLERLTLALEEVLDSETWEAYQRLIALPGAQVPIRNNLALYDELRPSTELEGLLVMLLRHLADRSLGDLDEEIIDLYPYLVQDDCAALSNNRRGVPVKGHTYQGQMIFLDAVKDNLYAFTSEYVPDDSHIAALRLLAMMEEFAAAKDMCIPVWLDGVEHRGAMVWSRSEIEMEYLLTVLLASRAAVSRLESHLSGDGQREDVSLLLSQVFMFLQIHLGKLLNGDAVIDELAIPMGLLRSRWLLSPAILAAVVLLSVEYNEEWAACLI